MSTLTQLVADHDNLVAQAALALPHSFSNCTYPLGSIRQAVYLCLICASPRGICSACSIACHGDHEQLELFPKRNFRCDCPTNVLAHACTLHKTPQIENEGNTYGQNFRGRFCRCGRPYDPAIERETMIQCLDCEVSPDNSFHLSKIAEKFLQDWYHESCLNLRERPSSREASPVLNSPPTNLHNPEEEANDNDNALSETSSSGLPPPLITGSEYDCFVCGSCVSRLPILKRYAGTPGVMMISRDGESEGPWKVIGRIQESSSQIEQDVEVSDPIVGSKRRRSPSVGNADPAPDTKRPRADTTSSAPCLAPVVSPTAEKIFALSATGDFSLGVGDIFLTQGWRERWCRCDTVSAYSSILLPLKSNPSLAVPNLY